MRLHRCASGACWLPVRSNCPVLLCLAGRGGPRPDFRGQIQSEALYSALLRCVGAVLLEGRGRGSTLQACKQLDHMVFRSKAAWPAQWALCVLWISAIGHVAALLIGPLLIRDACRIFPVLCPLHAAYAESLAAKISFWWWRLWAMVSWRSWSQ